MNSVENVLPGRRIKLWAVGFVVVYLCAFAATPAFAQYNRYDVYLKNSRNYAFCEIFLIIGQPPNLQANVYNTSGLSDCPADKFDKLDSKALAQQTKTEFVFLNPRRHWMMDHLWAHKMSEEVRDFDGIKAGFLAQMGVPPTIAGGGLGAKAFYLPMEVRLHSKYEYLKGKQVYLMRDPDGHTWVMQSYTNFRNKTLTQDQLSKLGSMLALPAGWKFEVKTLDKDLTIIPSGDLAYILQDNFEDTYEGCGFDDACSYTP